MQRNKSIDIAKGIGIIAVVWGHLQLACPIKSELYIFHMPLFFILSGYFFNDFSESIKQVLLKRFHSYLVPYFIFMIVDLLIFVILYLIAGKSQQIHISLGILFHPYGVVTPLWFLLCLFEVHILYYIIHRYAPGLKWNTTIILICYSISYYLFRCNIHLPLYLDSALSMLLFFHTGYLFNKYRIFNRSAIIQGIIAIAGILFYVMGVIQHLHIDIARNLISNQTVLFILSATGASFVVVYTSKYLAGIALISNFLSCLGRNSMLIFTLHMVCSEIARCLLELLNSQSILLNGICMMLTGLFGSLIIGYPIKKYLLPYVNNYTLKIIN